MHGTVSVVDWTSTSSTVTVTVTAPGTHSVTTRLGSVHDELLVLVAGVVVVGGEVQSQVGVDVHVALVVVGDRVRELAGVGLSPGPDQLRHGLPRGPAAAVVADAGGRARHRLDGDPHRVATLALVVDRTGPDAPVTIAVGADRPGEQVTGGQVGDVEPLRGGTTLDDDHASGVEVVPGLAAVQCVGTDVEAVVRARAGGRRLGLGQRGPSCAPHAGDADAVDQHRGAGLQDGGVRPVAVVGGDPRVEPQPDGCQLLEVRRTVVDVPAQCGEPLVGPVGVALVADQLDQPIEVAGLLVAGAGVQPGLRAVHAPAGQQDGIVECPGLRGRCAAAYIGTGVETCVVALDGGEAHQERVVGGRRRRLEDDACVVVAAQQQHCAHSHQGHDRDHGDHGPPSSARARGRDVPRAGPQIHAAISSLRTLRAGLMPLAQQRAVRRRGRPRPVTFRRLVPSVL